eukprot:971385-Prorocentrum_minimum.AAC.1
MQSPTPRGPGGVQDPPAEHGVEQADNNQMLNCFDCLLQVACKIHQLNTAWAEAKKQNYVKHTVREYNIHRQLDHPNVVRLYDVFEIDTNTFCTVMDFCEGGDLDAHLKENKMLCEREARSIIVQVRQ